MNKTEQKFIHLQITKVPTKNSQSVKEEIIKNIRSILTLENVWMSSKPPRKMEQQSFNGIIKEKKINCGASVTQPTSLHHPQKYNDLCLLIYLSQILESFQISKFQN